MGSRKSHSHSKKQQTGDGESVLFASPMRDLVHTEDGRILQKTLTDTAVMLQVPDSPAMSKKQNDSDLGVASLW